VFFLAMVVFSGYFNPRESLAGCKIEFYQSESRRARPFAGGGAV
jgi:hypothetical protein